MSLRNKIFQVRREEKREETGDRKKRKGKRVRPPRKRVRLRLLPSRVAPTQKSKTTPRIPQAHSSTNTNTLGTKGDAQVRTECKSTTRTPPICFPSTTQQHYTALPTESATWSVPPRPRPLPLSTLAKKLPAALNLFELPPSPTNFGVLSNQFFGDPTGDPAGLPADPFVTYNAPNLGGVDGDPKLSYDGDGVW